MFIPPPKNPNITSANGRNETIGVAATGKYSFNAKKTKPRPDIDESKATLGIFCRINSPNTHNNKRIKPVIKLLAKATYQANS